MSFEETYPWAGVSKTLHFPDSDLFQSFLSMLATVTRKVSETCYFNSIGSLLDLHDKFRSSEHSDLKIVWRSISVDECTEENELTCVGLAETLRGLILLEHPEWEDHIALCVTNEWTSKHPPSESFWTTTKPPLFPEQCREHCLLYIKVSLEQGRKAVVFLDPGRAIGTPIVATEDGSYPQSGTLSFKRYAKTKEHTVSWGGSDYMRWIIGVRKGSDYSEMKLRVYVGRRFQAGRYLDWHNLMFPYRALMFMTPTMGLVSYLRVDVVKTSSDHAIVYKAEGEEENQQEIAVPFESDEKTWDPSQAAAMKTLSDRVGKVQMTNYMSGLARVLRDRDFVEKLCEIWDKVKQETEDSFKEFYTDV